jgi:hypothetical protein
MIFRVTKGNAWVRQELIGQEFNLIDPLTVIMQKIILIKKKIFHLFKNF